ncbi:MAG: tRNA glutamyl-Q(34) synthetase GluQRS [Oscillospiraceae bacterium]
MLTGRFAPSPSGRMHLGNVFSALLAWLSVRNQGGRMLLRIEDLDPDRCRPEYAETLKHDLDWLGLDWDAEQTPQSRRTEAYRAEFDKLAALGLVYPCYCSRAELHAASAPHTSDGTVVYAGTCRDLTPEQRAVKTRAPAWRVRVPGRADHGARRPAGPVGGEDLARDCGDFIIRRSDGVYAYQLAVVTDDADGGVTEIVRGRDLLSSTPRQLWLQETIGFAHPAYYHVPLLTAPDGRRLSKREKDLDLGALRQRLSPQELLGQLAYLAGLQPEPAPATAAELASRFSWDLVVSDNIVIHSEFT